MSKWVRSSGFDQLGRKTIVITENGQPQERYRSLINRFQGLLMKLVFFLSIVLLVPLAMLINLLS